MPRPRRRPPLGSRCCHRRGTEPAAGDRRATPRGNPPRCSPAAEPPGARSRCGSRCPARPTGSCSWAWRRRRRRPAPGGSPAVGEEGRVTRCRGGGEGHAAVCASGQPDKNTLPCMRHLTRRLASSPEHRLFVAALVFTVQWLTIILGRTVTRVRRARRTPGQPPLGMHARTHRHTITRTKQTKREAD